MTSHIYIQLAHRVFDFFKRYVFIFNIFNYCHAIEFYLYFNCDIIIIFLYSFASYNSRHRRLEILCHRVKKNLYIQSFEIVNFTLYYFTSRTYLNVIRDHIIDLFIEFVELIKSIEKSIVDNN